MEEQVHSCGRQVVGEVIQLGQLSLRRLRDVQVEMCVADALKRGGAEMAPGPLGVDGAPRREQNQTEEGLRQSSGLSGLGRESTASREH